MFDPRYVICRFTDECVLTIDNLVQGTLLQSSDLLCPVVLLTKIMLTQKYVLMTSLSMNRAGNYLAKVYGVKTFGQMTF